MNTSNPPPNDKSFKAKALETTITIGIVVFLLYWCFKIAQPFIEIFVWGIIMAVAVHPVYNRLKSLVGGRGYLAATLMTLLAMIVLLVPTFMLSESLIKSAQGLSAHIDQGTLSIPPPRESVRTWPVIGEPLYQFWSNGSKDLGTTLSKMAPQIKNVSMRLLSLAADAGGAILKFVVSLIIAGVLLANTKGAGQVARAFAMRLEGERGVQDVELTEAIVRSVALGILGVALIQSLLAGLGFLLVGVPGAGLWALLVLILAVVQLPPLLVLIPIMVYVFSTSSMVPAIVFAIWCVFVGLCDSFLKPLLMGRGVDVPMLVIFIGAIGGFMASGIIGLFVGAIIFVLGYKLFLRWLNEV